jgi:hypothetical protein
MSARSRYLWTLLGASGVAAALVLYAYLGVVRRDEKAAAAKQASEKLVAPVPQPDGGTVIVRYDRLVMVSKGGTTELGRLPDGTWVISSPFRTRADARAAEDVVSTLQSILLNRIIEEAPTEEDLKRYGLAPPNFQVTASAEGVTPLTLSGGIDNPFDNSIYLRHAGDVRVYAVDSAAGLTLNKSTMELRAHDVVGVRDLGLLGVSLKSATHDWALEREPEKPWAFLRPAGVPADGAAISQWVALLDQQRATGFLTDSPAERTRTGVEKPSVDVTFRRKDETVRVRLALGTKDTAPAYVLREDNFGATLAEVPRTAASALDKAPAGLRDWKVLAFQPAEVERIRIVPTGGGPGLVVERAHADGGTTDRWVLASRTPGPASPSKIAALLTALSNLRSLPVEDTPPSDPGFGAKAQTVLLESRNGTVLATLVLGNPVKGKERTVWARNARGEVVEVDLSRLPALPNQREDLMEMSPEGVLAPAGPDAGH